MATTGLSSSEIADALKRARELATATGHTNSPSDSAKRPLDSESFSDGNPAKRLNSFDSMSAGNPITSLGAAFSTGMDSVQIENFQVPDTSVGLIIGRGGENITNMQNESGCKIQMSQTYADNTGKAMRGCTLTGTKSAIEKAKRLLEAVIEKSGGGSLMPAKNGTPSVMGMTSTSPVLGVSASSYGNPAGLCNSGSGLSLGGANSAGLGLGGGGKMITVEMIIPGTKCGLIIGKGGETIKQLQERAQVKMVMIQENNQVTTGSKPLRIIGEPEKIEHAKRLVEEVMNSKDDKAGGFINDYGTMPTKNQSMGEIIVPKEAVGVIIGKQGDTIRRLTLESGAKIQFKPDMNLPERTAYIVGTPEQIQRATHMITDLVNKAIAQNGGNIISRIGGDTDTFYMHVPANKTGLVIGKGGESIKQINAESGARVELSREAPPSENEKVFVIRGTAYQIHHAQHLIRIKVGDVPPGTPVPPFSGSMSGPAAEQQHFGYPGYAQPAQPTAGDQSAAWAAYYAQAQQAQFYQNPSNPYGAASAFPTSVAQATPATAVAAQPAVANSQNASGPAINPQTGQPDYSAQWAEYYRSLGLHDQAALIEQQARANQTAGGGPGQAVSAAGVPSVQGGGQPTAYGAYGQQQSAGAVAQYAAYGQQPTGANAAGAFQYGAPQY